MEDTLVETPLTLLDRCDRCGAAAQARATAEWGELLFCGHHLAESIDALTESGARIYNPN